jgi:hypothetical protein
MVNLIHNAIKFTPPGGNITISARRNDAEIIFSVSDTGVRHPSGDPAAHFRTLLQSRPVSLRRRHRAWAFPSPGTLSKRTAVDLGREQRKPGQHVLLSLCRLDKKTLNTRFKRISG